MNKPISNIYFLILLTGYIGGLFAVKIGIQLPLIVRNYYADTVALPIMLSLILMIFRHFKQQPFLVLSGYKVAVGFIYLSVFFEFFLPYFSTKYTKDYFDIIAYGIGAISFYAYQKMYLTHETKSIA